MSAHGFKFDLTALGEAEAGAPARVIAGLPRTKTWNLEEAPGSKVFSGVWECTPGTWRIAYEEWEFCTLLSGHSIVTENGQAPIVLKAGDTMILRPGFEGTWEVVETTRKLYVIYLT